MPMASVPKRDTTVLRKLQPKARPAFDASAACRCHRRCQSCGTRPLRSQCGVEFGDNAFLLTLGQVGEDR